METESIPQQVQEETKQIETADLVVGILTELDADAISIMCDTLCALPGPLRIAVLQEDHRGNSAAPTHSGITEGSSSIFFLPPLSATAGANPISMIATYRSVLATAEKLQSRACCVMASKIETGRSHWADQLTRPLLDGKMDLVVPRYPQHRFDGLLNSCIIAPLMRSLYGRRMHNPMGPDFGVSRRMFQKLLGPERNTGTGASGLHPLASLAPAALCENWPIAEAHLGGRAYPPPDWTRTSSLLADVLSPVFLDMERNASCWQRARIPAHVPTIGQPSRASDDSAILDTTQFIESFQLGNRELQEIWGLVLSPSTLIELRKLSRLPPEQFRMPDELWVKIVYDFAIAHRLRTISRDHLLKSMTPLYLGWVASYAHDLQRDPATNPDQRLERLALAFEAGKPFLVSRWRWPDRFNP